MAKNLDSYNYFKNLFKTRKIIKIYQALVHGKVETDQGIIYRPIIRSKKTGLMIAKSTPDSKAKKAITEFKVLERYKNYSLLKINLKTGRTHQIRVHLKSIGHSIVGDKLYKTKNLKNKINNKINLNNIFLCAVELEFLDINNNLQHYKINLPRNLKIFLNNLQSSRRRE